MNSPCCCNLFQTATGTYNLLLFLWGQPCQTTKTEWMKGWNYIPKMSTEPNQNCIVWYVVFLCALDLNCCSKTIKNTSWATLLHWVICSFITKITVLLVCLETAPKSNNCVFSVWRAVQNMVLFAVLSVSCCATNDKLLTLCCIVNLS